MRESASPPTPPRLIASATSGRAEHGLGHAADADALHGQQVDERARALWVILSRSIVSRGAVINR